MTRPSAGRQAMGLAVALSFVAALLLSVSSAASVKRLYFDEADYDLGIDGLESITNAALPNVGRLPRRLQDRAMHRPGSFAADRFPRFREARGSGAPDAASLMRFREGGEAVARREPHQSFHELYGHREETRADGPMFREPQAFTKSRDAVGGDLQFQFNAPSGATPQGEGGFAQFARFREQHEPPPPHANPDDPFGGAPSRHVPMPSQTVHVTRTSGPTERFQAPRFEEVFAQIKSIVSEKQAASASPSSAAAAPTGGIPLLSGHNMMTSVTHRPSLAQPHMAHGPSLAPSAGPPVPVPHPILVPIGREDKTGDEKGKEDKDSAASPRFAEVASATAAKAAPQPIRRKFTIVTAAQEQRDAEVAQAARAKAEEEMRRMNSATPPQPRFREHLPVGGDSEGQKKHHRHLHHHHHSHRRHVKEVEDEEAEDDNPEGAYIEMRAAAAEKAAATARRAQKTEKDEDRDDGVDEDDEEEEDDADGHHVVRMPPIRMKAREEQYSNLHSFD